MKHEWYMAKMPNKEVDLIKCMIQISHTKLTKYYCLHNSIDAQHMFVLNINSNIQSLQYLLNLIELYHVTI